MRYLIGPPEPLSFLKLMDADLNCFFIEGIAVTSTLDFESLSLSSNIYCFSPSYDEVVRRLIDKLLIASLAFYSIWSFREVRIF